MVDFSRDEFCQKFHPLSHGWQWYPLEKCVEILDHKRIPINQKERNTRIKGKPAESLYPYYGATGQVGVIDNHIFDEELVLLGEDGAPFLDQGKPKAYLVKGKCWVNNHAHVLRPNSHFIYASLLCNYLNLFDYSNYVTGTTRLKLNQSRMRKIPVLIPPLDEQHRIVARLEAILAQTGAARAALERVPDLLKTFRQAVLAAALRGELSERQPDDEPAGALLERIRAERRRRWAEDLRAKGKDPAKAVYQEPPAPDTARLPELPEGWVWTTVEELAYVGTGATPLRGTKKYWENGSIPWVVSGALNNPFIDSSDEMITPAAMNETNVKVYPPGTLLIAMYGEGRTRGLVSELKIHATTNQACAALVFQGQALMCKDFIKLFFEKNYEEIRELSSGGVQPNLNLSIIRKTTIPLPPVNEQRRMVEIVGALFKQRFSAQESTKTILCQLDLLEQVVFAKAFQGKL